MKKSIILGIGIVVSIFFIIFSASIFEAFYYEREFSNEMYNQGLYTVVAIATVAVVWLFAALFYYIIDSVRFSRWYHWGVMMIAAVFVVMLINTVYPDSVFASVGLNFSHRLFSFSIVNGIIAAVLFALASFSMRWWSKNCRHTPIPE